MVKKRHVDLPGSGFAEQRRASTVILPYYSARHHATRSPAQSRKMPLWSGVQVSSTSSRRSATKVGVNSLPSGTRAWKGAESGVSVVPLKN